MQIANRGIFQKCIHQSRVALWTIAVCAFIAPFGSECIILTAVAQPTAQTTEEARQARDRLLNQLGSSEAAILSGQGSSDAPTQLAQGAEGSKVVEIEKTALTRSQGEALRDAIEVIRSLEAQQESLIDEIVKYKGRTQSAASKTPREGNERDFENLARELDRERARTRDLEQDVANLKRDLEAMSVQEVDSKNVQERLAQGDRIAARLEKELEAKKTIAADNDFLRAEIEKHILKVSQLEKKLQEVSASDSGPADGSSAGEASQDLRGLEKDKRELQLKVAELQTKLDKDVDLLRQAAQQIKKFKDQLLEKEDELLVSQNELKTLQERLTEAAKSAGDLDAARAELGEKKLLMEKAAKELQQASAEIVENRRVIEQLRGQMQGSEQERMKLAGTVELLTADVKTRETELAEARSQLAKSGDDAKLCFTQLQEKARAANQIPTLEESVRDLQGKLTTKDSELSLCETKSKDKDAILGTLPGLRKQLLDAKNQLLLKETELQVRSGKTPLKSSSPEVSTNPSLRKELDKQRDGVMEATGRLAGEETVSGRASVASKTDVMIVTVRANKASLRAGPGPEHAPVMEVERGTTLVVEAREGEWYRVIAPNSTRAYIKADVVLTAGGPGDAARAPISAPSSRSPKKSPVRTVPVDPNMEPFGDVKPTQKTGDAEQRAIERLKSKLAKPE